MWMMCSFCVRKPRIVGPARAIVVESSSVMPTARFMTYLPRMKAAWGRCCPTRWPMQMAPPCAMAMQKR